MSQSRPVQRVRKSHRKDRHEAAPHPLHPKPAVPRRCRRRTRGRRRRGRRRRRWRRRADAPGQAARRRRCKTLRPPTRPRASPRGSASRTSFSPPARLTGQAGSALMSGATGRLWVTNDGRGRLELQSTAGDAQIVWNQDQITRLRRLVEHGLQGQAPGPDQGHDGYRRKGFRRSPDHRGDQRLPRQARRAGDDHRRTARQRRRPARVHGRALAEARRRPARLRSSSPGTQPAGSPCAPRSTLRAARRRSSSSSRPRSATDPWLRATSRCRRPPARRPST